MGRRSVRVLWVAVGMVTTALVAVVVTAFSFDMDEFLPYHEIACRQAGQALSVYQGACNVLPTQLFGWEFQRSFNYAGAMSTWLMTPVFAIWHSWWAHALVGVVSLAVTGLGITRSLRLPLAYAVSALAFFPLLFPTIHDTGPIRLALIVMAWSPVTVRYTLSPRHLYLRAAAGVALTLGWLAATESKPFFLFLIPGIAVWIVACLRWTDGKGFLRQHARGLIAWGAGLSLTCTGLLFVLRTEGTSYFAYLRGFPSPNDPIVTAGTALTFFGDWPFSAQRMVLVYPNVDAAFPKLLQSPLNALPLTTDRGAPGALVFTALAIACASGFVVWALIRCWSILGKTTTLLFLAAALILLVGPWVSGGGSVHHYVFSQVAVLAVMMLAATTLSYGALRSALCLAALSGLSLIAVLTTGRNPAVGRNVDEIMQVAFAKAGNNTVINCASWGCYHQFAFLDNKAAPVVFAETPQEQQQLKHDALEKGLEILQVCRNCTAQDIKQSAGYTSIQEVATVGGEWGLFAISP